MKSEHKEVPPAHYFPDGDKIQYWRSHKDGLVYGQLINKKGKPSKPHGKPFKYLGETP